MNFKMLADEYEVEAKENAEECTHENVESIKQYDEGKYFCLDCGKEFTSLND